MCASTAARYDCSLCRRPPALDPLLSLGMTARAAAAQRQEPVGAGGSTHGIRHQADVRFGHQRWPERQLYKVQLTSGCGWAVSLL